MADGFDIKLGEGGRVVVVLHPDCKTDKEKITDLLRDLGIDASLVVFLQPTEIIECTDLGSTPVIVLVEEGACDRPELDTAGRYCGQAGAQVIVLFAEGFLYEGLHPIAEKYGTQCGWSSDQLGACLSGDGADIPRSGSGSPVGRPDAGQVKC